MEDIDHESPLTSADLEEYPPLKKQKQTASANEEDEEHREVAPEDYTKPVARRPWKPPPLPEGHSYVNIKVKYHDDFDIVAAAKKWYNTDHPLLVVKHTRPKSGGEHHWHIHGALADVLHTGYRRVWVMNKKHYPHPLHAETGPKGKSIKPYSSKTFEEGPWENGYMYCVKPRECIGGCPVVFAQGFGEGDMYNIIQQSVEYDQEHNITFAQAEKDLIAKVLDATKHYDPGAQHHNLYNKLIEFYVDNKKDQVYNVMRKVTSAVCLYSPAGREYVYRSQWKG